ncbi:Protein kinase domain-containing protein [Madurella fahalii]|uniref:Protein kinase domain-containing protein n=1 Tax=Madurella fahalii TaxID=1157608 RepID=A0ABQ0GH59_9PEZI
MDSTSSPVPTEVGNIKWPPPWVPPPDPDRPPLPYLPGLVLDITEYIPPAPYYSDQGRPKGISRDALRSITHTELVITYPPRESDATTVIALTPKTATLTITNHIAVRDGRGAQIVLCSVVPRGPGPKCEPFTAVAKIFDPLYYSFADKYGGFRAGPVDVAVAADGNYSQEAAAYEHLQQAGETGSFAPKYYGSWTFSLPICHKGVMRNRAVRLILMEYLDGPCMRELCSDPRSLSYDEGYRLSVLAKLLDGHMRYAQKRLSRRGLLLPEHVILIPGPEWTCAPQPTPRVVLIDYCAAIVDERSPRYRLRRATELPVNPMYAFWAGDRLLDFDGWRPQHWNGNDRPVQEWLMEEFGGENVSKYLPVREGLELAPPKYFVGADSLDFRPLSGKYPPPPRFADYVPSRGTAKKDNEGDKASDN